MDEQRKQILNLLWAQIRRYLFCEQTNLIYDYLESFDEHRFDFLPFPEEIQRGFPNNKGYSTGMEDSMINAGMAIDICILRAELFPETYGECADFAGKLLKGMDLCATVHGRNGYIVRSVSHRDGKSCYPCSSRDQMTFWVWGLWRYFHSSFASEEERKRILELAIMLAERGEKEVIPENEWCILSLDGYPDSLNKMHHVQPHEILRLPMFYRVAFALSGERHWKECYDRLIGPALVEAVRPKENWNHFELSQFLLTLSLCQELDPRPEFVRIARKIAGTAEKLLLTEYLPRLEQWKGSWSIPALSWKESRNIILVRRPEGGVVGKDGRLDLRFRQDPVFTALFDLIRIPGNLMTGILLAQDQSVDPTLQKRFLCDFLLPEYSKIYTCAIVNMLYAALLLEYSLQKNKNASMGRAGKVAADLSFI